MSPRLYHQATACGELPTRVSRQSTTPVTGRAFRRETEHYKFTRKKKKKQDPLEKANKNIVDTREQTTASPLKRTKSNRTQVVSQNAPRIAACLVPGTGTTSIYCSTMNACNFSVNALGRPSRCLGRPSRCQPDTATWQPLRAWTPTKPPSVGNVEWKQFRESSCPRLPAAAATAANEQNGVLTGGGPCLIPHLNIDELFCHERHALGGHLCGLGRNDALQKCQKKQKITGERERESTYVRVGGGNELVRSNSRRGGREEGREGCAAPVGVSFSFRTRAANFVAGAGETCPGMKVTPVARQTRQIRSPTKNEKRPTRRVKTKRVA